MDRPDSARRRSIGGEFRRLANFARSALLLIGGLLLREVFGFGKKHNRLLLEVGPGKNPLAALKSKNHILYLMCVAYQLYSEKKTEFLSKTNEEFQRRYWSDYPVYYELKSKENFANDYYGVFDTYFKKALSEWNVITCLDIGCGGFTHILRLRAIYRELQYVGIDFSKISEEIYRRSILGTYENIQFVSGNVCDCAETVNEVDLFYTFGVLMYMTAAELERFLAMIRDVPRPLVGIIVEPDNERTDLMTYAVGQSFRHNYLEYFRWYGFRILDYTRRNHVFEADLPMIFVYFATKPSERQGLR